MLYDAREAALRDQLTSMKSSEAKGTAKTICQYLEARFGAESQALQERVRTIKDLDTLSRITSRIFIVTHLEEATALVHDNLVSQ